MNKWIEALKIFNKGKGEWCVPKKGTAEYNEVHQIMNPKIIVHDKRTHQQRMKDLKEVEKKVKQDRNIYLREVRSWFKGTSSHGKVDLTPDTRTQKQKDIDAFGYVVKKKKKQGVLL